MGVAYFFAGVLFTLVFCIGLAIIDARKKEKARKKFIKDLPNIKVTPVFKSQEEKNAQAIAESLDKCKAVADACMSSLKKLSANITSFYVASNKLRVAYGLPPITHAIDIIQDGDMVEFSSWPYSLIRIYHVDGCNIYDSKLSMLNWRRITAIYRQDGDNFKCIWERNHEKTSLH